MLTVLQIGVKGGKWHSLITDAFGNAVGESLANQFRSQTPKPLYSLLNRNGPDFGSTVGEFQKPDYRIDSDGARRLPLIGNDPDAIAVAGAAQENSLSAPAETANNENPSQGGYYTDADLREAGLKGSSASFTSIRLRSGATRQFGLSSNVTENRPHFSDAAFTAAQDELTNSESSKITFGKVVSYIGAAIDDTRIGVAKGIIQGIPKSIASISSAIAEGAILEDRRALNKAGTLTGINLVASASNQPLNKLAAEATSNLPTGEFFTYDQNPETGINFQAVGGFVGEFASPLVAGKAFQLGGKALYSGFEYAFNSKYGAGFDVKLNPFPKSQSIGSENPFSFGQFSQLSQGGGLQVSENAGGHLIARHIAKSEQSLFARLAAEPHISGSSSFYNRATAEEAVSRALTAKQTEINAFLASPKTKTAIEYQASYNVGISVTRGATNAIDTSSLRLILVRDASQQNGFKILTGFPIQ
jgi:hypothetical protein